jgi:hypothetical protein
MSDLTALRRYYHFSKIETTAKLTFMLRFLTNEKYWKPFQILF